MDDIDSTPYRDGPILVRGPIRLVDAAGLPIESTRKVVALCRCGGSSIKPLCDGSHKRMGFTAPGRDGRVPRCALEAPSEE